MSEYIKREDTLEELKEVVYRELASDPDNVRANTIIDAIEGIYSADVEPVVRCQKCENTHAPFPNGNFYCTKLQCAVKPEFYCADGEPKIEHNVQYRPCGR